MRVVVGEDKERNIRFPLLTKTVYILNAVVLRHMHELLSNFTTVKDRLHTERLCKGTL